MSIASSLFHSAGLMSSDTELWQCLCTACCSVAWFRGLGTKCVIGILLSLVMKESHTHQVLHSSASHSKSWTIWQINNFPVTLFFLSWLYGLFCRLFREGTIFWLSCQHHEVLITDHRSEDTNISLMIESLKFNYWLIGLWNKSSYQLLERVDNTNQQEEVLVFG